MKILLTGGGTAGHITPNIALLPALKKEGFEITYVGGKNGIEKELISRQGIEYHGVSTGKLRRYASMENIKDIFRVNWGVIQAIILIRKLKPDIVFSKGGFVAVPVVIGAKINGVPVVAHESDITPGLANKIAAPFAKAICVTFESTLKYLPKGKGAHTGAPIRSELLSGDPQKGRDLCGFDDKKPIALIMGGSLGSVKINECLRGVLDDLTADFNIIHICGKGNKVDMQKRGYKQFEYVNDELKDIFAAADLVVSRAGSNSISEFLALKKPNLLIPLSAAASRGDQILNAEEFKQKGYSAELREEDLSGESLKESIKRLYADRQKYISAMETAPSANGADEIIRVIKKALNK